MKKYIALLLVLVMLFSMMLTACGNAGTNVINGDNPGEEKEETVTVYIPATVVVSDGEGKEQYTICMEFEDGWQDKESFEARYTTETEVEGLADRITYGEKSAVSIYESGNIDRMEMEYDDQGRVVKQTILYRQDAQGHNTQKQSTISVYDERGLLQTQKTLVHTADSEEPIEAEVVYTYEETDEGYVGTSEEVGDGLRYVVVCNQEGKTLSNTVYLNDQEQSRTENTYDEHGNLIRSEMYFAGERMSRTENTFTAVEVSEETAERYPQFRRAD